MSTQNQIPQCSLHVFLVALSLLRGVSKYTVSGDWCVCPVDLVASLCVQCRTDQLLELLSCQVMDAFYELCIEYLGYHLAIVRSGLVGYLTGRFGYNLVSCTLSGTQL